MSMEHLVNAILVISVINLIVLMGNCIAVSIIRSKVEQIMYILGIKGTSIEKEINDAHKK